MNNRTIEIKIKERLNKLDSLDYDNIACWQIVEAFNKSQLMWCRRQLHGGNIYKEGDEMSKRRVDDLQILLKELTLLGSVTTDYFESAILPGDYFEYKRVSSGAVNECCLKPRSMTVYLGEEANRELILRDPLKRPDFEWGETFCTMFENKIRVYIRDFTLVKPVLTYYRKPRQIEILNCTDPYTGFITTIDVPSEFKDDIVELMIDEAASLIAGDIDEMNQYQRGQQEAERSN